MKNIYRNHVVKDYEYKPLLRKKGKQWITVGLSALALLGLGGLFNVSANASTNTVKANINHNLAQSNQEQVVRNPISQAKKVDVNTSNTSTQNIHNQANDLHTRILANQVHNNSNVSNQGRVNQNSGATDNPLKKVASSSANYNTLHLGSPTQQKRAWNYVQKGVNGHDFDTTSVSASSSNSALNTNNSSNSNNASNASKSSSSNAPKYETVNALEVGSDGNAGTHTLTGDNGLNATYKDDGNGNLEYISGDMGHSLRDFNDNIVKVNDGNGKTVTARTIKIDSDVNTNNLTNAWGMFQNDQNLTKVILPRNFGPNITNAGQMFESDGNLLTVILPNHFGQNITDAHAMFANDGNLSTVILPNHFGQNITNASDMFASDSSLHLLTLPSGFGQNITNASDMFYSTAIQSFNLPANFNAKTSTNNFEFAANLNLRSLTINSSNTKINSDAELPIMYKEVGGKDSQGQPYTLSTANDFSKGNLGTFTIYKNVKPKPVQSDSDTVAFVDKKTGHAVAKDTEYGKDDKTFNINNIIPSGYKLDNPSSSTFTFNNGYHQFLVDATNSNDNVPVKDDPVDVHGVITLHFHDGKKDIKDIPVWYSGQTTANHNINILNNAEIQANTPNDYLNKTIKNFNTQGFSADGNDNAQGLYNFTINPADATHINGSTREMRKDITLNYSVDRSKDNNDSNLPGHNGVDNISFYFVDSNGNSHKVGFDTIYGHNGSDANIPSETVPVGFHIDPEDENVDIHNNNSIIIKNGNHSINVLPNKAHATICYMNNGQKIASDTINGNDSSDSSKGVSDTSININSDYHPNLPEGYNINGNINVPFDNGSHNINADANNATDRIVYISSDGTSHGSDKINGKLNSDIKINNSNKPGIENGYQLVNSDNANNGNIFKDNNQTYTVLVKGSNVGYNSKNSDATNKKFKLNVNVHKMINGKSDGTKTITLTESGANNSSFAIHNDDNSIISQLPKDYLDGFTATGQDYTRIGILTTNGIQGIPNNTVDFYYAKDSNDANAITVNYKNGNNIISSGTFSKPLNTTGNTTDVVPLPAGYKLANNQNAGYKATDQPQSLNIQIVPKSASELPSDTNQGNIRLNLVFKENGKWQNEKTAYANESSVKVGSDFTITAPNENGYQLISNNNLKGKMTPSGANPYTLTFVYNANSASTPIHFTNNNGKDITPKNANANGNVNDKANFVIPKGYHLPEGVSYHFNANNQLVDNYGNIVPNNNIKVIGDKIVGTAKVHLVYQQTNGQTTDTTANDAQVVLHGEVGGSQTISAINYMKNGYTPNTSDWTINFTPSDINTNDQDGFNFTPRHTFEYDATTADPVEVAYIDTDDGNKVVGHSNLSNFGGIVGQKVRLAQAGTGVNSDGTYYDLNIPAGYYLAHTYNPIILRNNPQQAQQKATQLNLQIPSNVGMLLTVNLNASKPVQSNVNLTDTVNFMHGNKLIRSKIYVGKKGTNINYANDIPSDYNETQTNNNDTFKFNGGTHTVQLGINRPNGDVIEPVQPIQPKNKGGNKPKVPKMPNKPNNNNNNDNNNGNIITPTIIPQTPKIPSIININNKTNNNPNPNNTPTIQNNNKPNSDKGSINININVPTHHHQNNNSDNSDNNNVITPVKPAIKRVNSISQLANVKTGQTVNYNGIKLTNIIKHPYYIYNIKNILLHRNIKNIGNVKKYAVKVSAERGFTGKILSEFKVNGKKRFLIRWNNNLYFTTASHDYVRNAYIQPKEFNQHAHGNVLKYATIKLRKSARVYNSIAFNNKTFQYNLKKGTKVQITGLKSFGQKGYKRTRLVLNNGLIITSNKNFVKFLK